MSSYSAAELQTSNFGDERLNKRYASIFEKKMRSPNSSIPSIMGGWSETKAVYRFIENPKVTQDKLMQPHKDQTIERIKKEEVVLIAQDTTEHDFTKREIEGVGYLSYKNRTGFLTHLSLAMTPEQIPLGVTDKEFIVREEKDFQKSKKRKQVSFEEKESYRWYNGYVNACNISEQAENTQIISMSDREGDIYEIFAEVERRKLEKLPYADWIIRSNQNRSISKQNDDNRFKKLHEEVEKTKILGEIKFNLKSTKNRKKRDVTQVIRAGTFNLKPPWRKDKKLSELKINIVHAKEINHPEDEAPIEWFIITNLPINTLEDSKKVIEYYTKRWQIEIFFKVLKSGTKVEECQFNTIEAMQKMIVLYSIVAWRLMYLMRMGRECPNLPCDLFYSTEEWKVICIVSKKKRNSIPTLSEINIMVAKLGGYLGRKNDAPPGPKNMWTGLRRLRDLVIAFEIAEELNTKKS